MLSRAGEEQLLPGWYGWNGLREEKDVAACGADKT
jgi:hypothetical protein